MGWWWGGACPRIPRDRGGKSGPAFPSPPPSRPPSTAPRSLPLPPSLLPPTCSRSISAERSEQWIRPGSDVDSIRLAVFTARESNDGQMMAK